MSGVRRNLFGSGYLAAANLGSQVVLVPFFLHYWGTQVYGGWLVLFTIPTFFVFSDAGLSNTVGNGVTLALEQGRRSEAEAKLNAAWKFQAIAWAVIFVIFGLLLMFCPLQRWLGVTELSAHEFVPTTLLLCLYSLVSLQTGVLAAIYRGAKSYPAYLTWNAHARVLETGLVILTLMAGGRLNAVAGAMLVARVLGALVLYVYSRKLLPELRLAFFAGRWSDLVPLLPSGLAFLSFPLANALINQGVVLLVNHIAGPLAVVLLSVCRQLARVFQQGTSIILTAFQPEMTSAYGAGNRVRVQRLQSLALIIPLFAAVPFIAGNAFFGATVIGWWTQKNLGVTWPMMLACSLEAVAFGCGALCCLVPWSINHVRGLSIVYVGTNSVGVVLAGLGVLKLGIIAVPIAFFGAALAYCFTGLRMSCRAGGFEFSSLLAPQNLLATVTFWRARVA